MTDKHPISPPAPSHTNRLALEHNPYLLKHAHNPVNWYPWGEEAFEEAKKKDIPFFLSIGYSTCHWCHVMEVESFEDEQVAKLLNDWFVSTKVDREEQPDVNKVYMTYVQALYGGGGWPLTCFLSPDLKPLMGGTYLPPEDIFGRPGFKTILRSSPSLNFPFVTGDYAEGLILTASYGYIGGHEGKSVYNWYLHEIENGAGSLVQNASGHLQYRITKDAIGKFVSFKCSHVRDDDVFGEPRTTMAQERVPPDGDDTQ